MTVTVTKYGSHVSITLQLSGSLSSISCLSLIISSVMHAGILRSVFLRCGNKPNINVLGFYI